MWQQVISAHELAVGLVLRELLQMTCFYSITIHLYFPIYSLALKAYGLSQTLFKRCAMDVTAVAATSRVRFL